MLKYVESLMLLNPIWNHSYDKKEDQTSWKRKEYIPKGFVRQFELNEKIDRSAIEAKYLVRTLLSDLRIGIKESTIRESLAKAFFKEDDKEAVE